MRRTFTILKLSEFVNAIFSLNSLKKTKTTLLLFAVFLMGSNVTSAQPWTYDFGTATGNPATNPATNFFASTPSGGGTYRVRSGTAGVITLANPGTTLGTGSELQITAGTGTSTTKFSVFGWDSPTTASYLKCKIRSEATNTGNFWIMIGGNSGIYTDNNTTTFTNGVSQLFFSYNASGVLTVQRRDGNAYNASAITQITEATDQIIEIYVNNASTATSYYRGTTTYTLNSQTWDLWVDGTKVSAANGWAKGAGASSISAGTLIGAFGFFAESSSASNAKLFIDDIEYLNALPAAITVPSPTSLSGFSTPSGTPSASQSFTVGGSNLTANLVVTAPADYEVSDQTAGIWGPTVTYTPTSGTVASQTVNVRIKSAAGVGTPSGNVAITSTGATTQNVAVSGIVSAASGPLVTITGSLSPFGNVVTGTSSAEQSYQVNGDNLTNDIVITPPSGFEISL